MLRPSIFGENLFDDLFDEFDHFPFFDDKEEKKMERKLYGRRAKNLMKTDIKEKNDVYELAIELPGFKKRRNQSIPGRRISDDLCTKRHGAG